jgi:hypothetical protein
MAGRSGVVGGTLPGSRAAESALPMSAERRDLNLVLRIALAVVGVTNLVSALAFAFQLPWALAILPWGTGRLSYVFIGSIFAATGAGVLWIAVSQETGSMPAGFLNLTVTLGGIAASLVFMAAREDRGELVPVTVTAGLLAAANIVLFSRTRRLGDAASESLPWLVRGSFIAFTAILLAVGVSLIAQAPRVMPWPLDPETSLLIGWIFFGNAFYFLYGAVRARWDSARAQLWSFLAYDVVLIGPLLLHYPNAPAELRTNVVVYSAVLIYSGALAVYYVVLNRNTRGWNHATGSRPAAAPAS